MDSKADRKQRVLTIHNLYFEKVKLSKTEIGKITGTIKAFARFNQCIDVEIKKSNNREYIKNIKQGLAE